MIDEFLDSLLGHCVNLPLFPKIFATPHIHKQDQKLCNFAKSLYFLKRLFTIYHKVREPIWEMECFENFWKVLDD